MQHIIDLIRSLSKSEKRYFQLYASRAMPASGSVSYLKIYEILKEATGNEMPELKEQVGSKNLPYALNYLYHKILESMRSYHADEAEAGMADLRFLYARGLQKPFMKKYIQLKHELKGKHSLLPYLRLLDLQTKIAFEGKLDFLPQGADTVQQEKKDILEQIYLHNELEGRKLEILAFVKKYPRATTHTVQAHDPAWHYEKAAEIIKEQSLLPQVQREWYYVNAYFHHYNSDLELAKSYFQKLMALFEYHPQWISDSRQEYIKAISNYLNNCLASNDLAPVEAGLEKLRSLKVSGYADEAEAFQHNMHLTILYLLKTGKLEEIMDIYEAQAPSLRKYEKRINKNRLMTIYYNVMLSFFVKERYNEVIEIIGHNLINYISHSRQDLKAGTRIVYFISYMELGRKNDLESLYRSMYKFLKDASGISYVEEYIHILKTLKKYAGNGDLKALTGLETQLNRGDSGIIKNAGISELLLWLHSKINDMTLLETYKERLQEKEVEK